MQILSFIIISSIFFCVFSLTQKYIKNSRCNGMVIEKFINESINSTVKNNIPQIYLNNCTNKVNSNIEINGFVNNESKR